MQREKRRFALAKLGNVCAKIRYEFLYIHSLILLLCQPLYPPIHTVSTNQAWFYTCVEIARGYGIISGMGWGKVPPFITRR